VSSLCGRDGRCIRERWGTTTAPTGVSLEGVTSSDPVPSSVSGTRRRTRAEAARSASVSVRLSPDEAAVLDEAAGQVGMSVGAWIAETAIGRARSHTRGGDAGEVDEFGPSSRRELVAALVALRAEVAALPRRSVVELGSAVPAGELLDDQLTYGTPGGAAFTDVVVGVLRRIDALTEAAMDAAASSAGVSSSSGRERPERP
jgi:hypothetical protein